MLGATGVPSNISVKSDLLPNCESGGGGGGGLGGTGVIFGVTLILLSRTSGFTNGSGVRSFICRGWNCRVLAYTMHSLPWTALQCCRHSEPAQCHVPRPARLHPGTAAPNPLHRTGLHQHMPRSSRSRCRTCVEAVADPPPHVAPLPGGATRVPKPALRARFQQFFRGEWPALLEAAAAATNAQTSAAPPQPRQDARADRAVHLAHFGESAARQALLAEPLVAGDDTTLQHLRDPVRRPVAPYEPLGPDILAWCPDSPVEVSCPALLTNLRRSGRGPSGYMAEMVRLILDDSAAVDSFGAVATRLARAQLPATIAQALALGRLIDLLPVLAPRPSHTASSSSARWTPR